MSTSTASDRASRRRQMSGEMTPHLLSEFDQGPVLSMSVDAPAAVMELAGAANTVGYLVADASTMSAHLMACLIRHTDGFVCVAMDGAELDRLGLPPMVEFNESIDGQDYTVSVDAAHGITTGISAHDRARTVRTLADTSTTATDLIRPGHVLPVRTSAHAIRLPLTPADAALALVARAGLGRTAAFAAILDHRGEIASHHELASMARTLGLPHVRTQLQAPLSAGDSLRMPSGAFRSYEYRSPADGTVRVALTRVPRT